MASSMVVTLAQPPFHSESHDTAAALVELAQRECAEAVISRGINDRDCDTGRRVAVKRAHDPDVEFVVLDTTGKVITASASNTREVSVRRSQCEANSTRAQP